MKYIGQSPHYQGQNIDITGPAQGVRGNRLRLRREALI